MTLPQLPLRREGDAAEAAATGPALPQAAATAAFADRHLGSSDADLAKMLSGLGLADLEALLATAVPASIRLPAPPAGLPLPASEAEALAELRLLGSRNSLFRSYLGLGYHAAHLPPVLQRNILENPGWYTPYTPYQAEISQGRLEAMLTFQSMVADLTGLPIANASLLDEATAAAEAMVLAFHARGTTERCRFLAADDAHPQTLAVLRTRARPLGIDVATCPVSTLAPDASTFGVFVQDPSSDGAIRDLADLATATHAAGALLVAATDLLALTLLRPPGEWGADVAVGSSQRFGLPLGAGGPHAAFFATRDEFKRLMPGRLVGVSRDADGRPALRLALQTREQHIRRDKATSNICTAQVLPAVIAAMYAVWHGPDGLRALATRIHGQATTLATLARSAGLTVRHAAFFDTLALETASPAEADALLARATGRRINLRRLSPSAIGIALDETITAGDLADLAATLAPQAASRLDTLPPPAATPAWPAPLLRRSGYLAHDVFHRHRTEHEMLRYLKRLESRDLSLTTSMIPLGSCTMKLNAAAEMIPLSWPEWSSLHPFAPADQLAGYATLCSQLEDWLARLTGFAAVSLQPNAGSQGEYAGLLAIRAWHAHHGQGHRDVCLIPLSAHGTNPASAVLAGYRVVPVACDARGDIDLADLRAKAATHGDRLAALMVTYPSTHGVFEEGIVEVCATIHAHGGQVYMDGANFNAQVGVTTPAAIGADVCHLNLHKTFCIPHGGGGPGMGPIAVAAHLAPFLPAHPLTPNPAAGAVSAAPWGSALILVISWAYIRMMGADGLRRATAVAILNANHIARRLAPHFPILYRGSTGLVAHECILDLRPAKAHGIEVEDVAKRLIDCGFHAPTMSWPVPGTLMVEPTESESLAELDRFCDAMATIAAEIADVAAGRLDRTDNPLKRAPHPLASVVSDSWSRPYPRERAAFPTPHTRAHKYWPPVARVDNAHGDRHLVCSCAGMENFGS